MDKQHNKNSHGHKLRIGRYSHPNQTYLVTAVTYKRNPLFEDIFLGRIAIQSMKTFEQKRYLDSLAYVVMPDHIHWLFQLKPNRSLPETIRQFKGYTSFKINRSKGVLHNKVWQNGYHDHALGKEEDIKDIARYIVSNPLRAGLATKIGNYSLWDARWL